MECCYWIRSTLTDEDGQYDIAYVSLFFVMGAVVIAILTMCFVSTFAYFRCDSFVVNGVTVNCTYDPQPLGTAIGLACGGFATALGALAGYMLATRPPPRPVAPQPLPSPININTAQPAPSGPLDVNLVGTPGHPPS